MYIIFVCIYFIIKKQKYIKHFSNYLSHNPINSITWYLKIISIISASVKYNVNLFFQNTNNENTTK